MVRPVLLLSSILLIFWFFTNCREPRSAELIKTEYKIMLSSDSSIYLKKGLMMVGNEPFTGKLVTLFLTRDTAAVCGYFRGREHGALQTWYPNGVRKDERYFSFGRKEREHKGWWPTGRNRYVYNFMNDVYEGSIKEWYESGQQYTEFNYIAGHEQGLQQAWNSDGKLNANYIVKEGRKYGLTGTKNCKSLTTDVKSY